MLTITRHAVERRKAHISLECRKPFYARFWEKVEVRGPDDCWNWTGSTDGKGYGQISVAIRADGTRPAPIKAHRAAWMLTFGEYPTNYACHTGAWAEARIADEIKRRTTTNGG